MVEGKVTIRFERGENGANKGKFVVGCDIDGNWVLHWGVTYFDQLEFGSEWEQPPDEMRPPGSIPIKDYAIETPLRKSSTTSKGEMLHEVKIDFNFDSSIAAIHFVLKEEVSGAQYQHKGSDFKILLIDNVQEDNTGTDGSKDLFNSSGVKVDGIHLNAMQNGLLEGYHKEYSICKEEQVTNYVTVSVMRNEEVNTNHLLFDTDIPGEVIVHWGVCKGDDKSWHVPQTPHPPKSRVFRKKAVETLLQKKPEDVGSWGLFPVDKDISGVPFVLKLNKDTWLDNMGIDFYVPLVGDTSLEYKTKDQIEAELASTDVKEAQAIESSTNPDEIITEIRNLVTDISAEKSLTTTTKEAQESILEEIEKLAAEAYSVFRSITPVYVEEPISDATAIKPPIGKCPGTGSGYEVFCQVFNWESCKSKNWYSEITSKAGELSKLGITVVWLPPPTESVSPQGYMPSDLYNLNSSYGSMEDLKNTIKTFHSFGIKVVGDVVLNHRCAQHQNKNGIWNIFGGRLNWDDRAIVADDPHYQGRGNKSSGENFHAAPNIDHSQEFVRRDLKEWLCWLRKEIGFDGWRLDFARGFWGGYMKDYMEASEPYFSVGEFWDSLSYTYGEMDYNQDAHRQRCIDWINATNGTTAAFDVTLKGILHTTLEKVEYWRLSDERGKAPGVAGWWPSRGVTFIENHDTGSTQGHWRFPAGKEMQGYAYILTHSGTPTIFYDHLCSHYNQEIAKLIAFRHRKKIHCRSKVKIRKAEKEVYAAIIDDKVAMKIGPGHYDPGDHNTWKVAAEGRDYKVWETD